MPFGSKKGAYKNSTTLGFLSTRQALADVATLVTDLKKNLSAVDSPVVVFGGGYSGCKGTHLLFFIIRNKNLVLGSDKIHTC